MHHLPLLNLYETKLSPMVGDGVGLAVGEGVGLGVGDGVGLGVGDGVGLGVGDGVGMVIQCWKQPSGTAKRSSSKFPTLVVILVVILDDSVPEACVKDQPMLDRQMLLKKPL